LVLGFGLWLWVAALFAAPVALRPVCAFICHQRPERSFFVAGAPLPVCARCTGLYLGAALAMPLALVAGSIVPARRARVTLLLAALPTALTWMIEFAGWMPFSNTARAIAALPLGFAAAWLVLTTIGDN
jgi:uncharacterized membrane protein